jgi:hypothetical protein
MTFDEAINRYQPASPELALMEPWVSGGTTAGGVIVTHHTDLPRVYGFIWRLHPDYRGPLTPGDMVLFPRYGYETIAEGSSLDDDGKWELTVIRLDNIEAIIRLDPDEHPDEVV